MMKVVIERKEIKNIFLATVPYDIILWESYRNHVCLLQKAEYVYFEAKAISQRL